MKQSILIIAFSLYAGLHLHAQSGIKELKDKTAFEAAIANNEKAVVVFAAEWCDYCKDFLPKVEKITSDDENVKFFKINYNENMAFFRTEGIEMTPTTRLYKNGIKTDEMVILEAEPLQEKLQGY